MLVARNKLRVVARNKLRWCKRGITLAWKIILLSKGLKDVKCRLFYFVRMETYCSWVHQTGLNNPECRHNACTMEYTVRFDSETLQQYNLYTTLTVCSLECIVAISELCATKTDQFHKLQKPTQQQLTRGHCTDINVKTAVYMHVNGDVQDSTFKTAKIIKSYYHHNIAWMSVCCCLRFVSHCMLPLAI